MRILTLLALASIAMLEMHGRAVAQTHGAETGCFHVSYANTGALPGTAILWNSCTGETWLLLQEAMVGKDGKRDGAVWEWFPVIFSKKIATSE